MRFLFLSLLIFVSCSDAQVTKMLLKGKTVSTADTGFPAMLGNEYFAMNDIPGENLPYELWLDWDMPAGGNLPLLVYVHGWNGGGGLQGSFDTAARDYLKTQGIAMMSVGMRGRNTNPDTSTDNDIMESLRDGGAIENYDVLASIRHLLNEVVVNGKIDKTKISFWVISGGGGAGAGCANKFPGLISTDILWYAISKYGTYESDPLPSLTSWYTDNALFEGKIQGAVGASPKGETGYIGGLADEEFIARDHITGIGNSPETKFHVYHDSGDGTVFDDLSNALTAKLLANGQDYEYHYATNGDYDHGEADLLPGKFSISPQFGLHWVEDVKTVNRTYIGNTGTLHVAGYVIPVDEDLNPIFELWIKSYRKNNPSIPKAQSYRSQGRTGAATVTYNLTSNTFVTQLIKGNASAGEQYNYIDITKGSDNVIAMLATNDVVTLKPTTFNTKPASLTSYDWKFYYNFGSSDNYLLDDAGKVSNAWDLTGNKNIAFHEVRASRASIVSGALDNGLLKLAGSTGTLATNIDLVTLTNEFTIAFSIDPDQTNINSFTDLIIGKGTGGASGFYLANFSGKISTVFTTESGNAVSNATPNNSDLGKQVWVIRRDGSNVVTATCMNSTSTYSYTLGTSAGSFITKVIGASSSFTKQFSGKIYRVAVSDDRINDTDMTTLLTDWYNN